MLFDKFRDMADFQAELAARDIAPFGGGGLGLSRTTLTTTGPGATGRSESSTLAWQAGGGLAYHVAPWLRSTLGPPRSAYW